MSNQEARLDISKCWEFNVNDVGIQNNLSFRQQIKTDGVVFDQYVETKVLLLAVSSDIMKHDQYPISCRVRKQYLEVAS
ncbi:hypothetical protein RR48_04498 [Papilio machaon]|uniref:Uncharacterized protein n=1 Tax=Papilio machaon TaxID=76193 RepID=A0A0N1IA06_PAPMA|nr:hypothetical protein RR48_04498 [Papilio machaon]